MNTNDQENELGQKEILENKSEGEVCDKKRSKLQSFVLTMLFSEKLTKEQLAKKVMENGLTSLQSVENVVRSLGVLFHRFKSEGIKLEKENVPREGRGRPKGIYFISENNA